MWQIPFLAEYKYLILFGFHKSPNTKYWVLFGIEETWIPNTKYYSVSRKSNYRIRIVLFGLTIQIPNTKYWIVYNILEEEKTKIKIFVPYKTFCSKIMWNYTDKYSVQLFEHPNTIRCAKKPEYQIPNTIRYWENPNTEYEYYYSVQLFE